MKLYQDCKKRFKIRFFIFLGILIIFVPVFSYAQTAGDINDKINQKNADINALEQEITQYQTQLDSLAQQKDSLNGSLKELDLTKKKLVASMSVTQNKIDETNLKIQELGLQINNKQDIILNNMAVIVSGIKQVNEFEQSDTLATMLSGDDFTTIWNDLDNMSTLSDKLRETTVILKQAKSDLEDTKKQTINAKNELVTLKSNLADQKKIVDQNVAEKNKLLAQTKNSEASYQKLLTTRLVQKATFEKELNDYESQLKYVLNPSSLPNAGVLSWPLDYIYVTQYFGKTEAGKRLYANGTHNGVDFRASIGTPVKAMADGVVAGLGDTDLQCPKVSFGRFILIKYDDGLASTFGHLSLIKVTTGDRVTRGQIVGYSGDTGYATGPHLHVSVYARDAVNLQTLPSISCPGRVLTQPISPINAYLDPMYYLPPYNK